MTVLNVYITAGELKKWSTIDDYIDDVVIESVIAAVSREIEEYCKRRFWKNVADEDRYYKAQWGDLLFTDDIVSLTSVAIDEHEDRTYSRPLSPTDYDLEPYNATLDLYPYTALRMTQTSSYAFSVAQKGNKLTGIFGWPSIPSPIVEACLIQSQRIFKRKDAPFGVMGSAEMGTLLVLPKFDPDVKMLLDPFRKNAVIW